MDLMGAVQEMAVAIVMSLNAEIDIEIVVTVVAEEEVVGGATVSTAHVVRHDRHRAVKVMQTETVGLTGCARVHRATHQHRENALRPRGVVEAIGVVAAVAPSVQSVLTVQI